MTSKYHVEGLGTVAPHGDDFPERDNTAKYRTSNFESNPTLMDMAHTFADKDVAWCSGTSSVSDLTFDKTVTLSKGK